MKINLKLVAGIVIAVALLFVGLEVWQHFNQAKTNNAQMQLYAASKKTLQ